MLQTRQPEQSSERQALYSPSQLAWQSKAQAFANRIPLEEVLQSDRENIFRHCVAAALTSFFSCVPVFAQFRS